MTLTQLIAKLRRRGVTFRVVGGEVHVDGWPLLSATEQARLREDREDVKARLEARERRRQERADRKRKKDQQQEAMPQEQKERKVVGQHVVPGYPQLSRPLYADECRTIDTRTARVLKKISYGWLVGGDE